MDVRVGMDVGFDWCGYRGECRCDSKLLVISSIPYIYVCLCACYVCAVGQHV